MRPVVVLGSASPARRALLRAAGIEPVVLASEVDEDALVLAAGDRARDVRWLTAHLAGAKASDVAATISRSGLPGSVTSDQPVLVVAADSLLAFEDHRLDPGCAQQCAPRRRRRAQYHDGAHQAGAPGTAEVAHSAADHRVGAAVSHASRPHEPPRTPVLAGPCQARRSLGHPVTAAA